MFGHILTSSCKYSHKLNKMDICVLFLNKFKFNPCDSSKKRSLPPGLSGLVHSPLPV